MDRVRIRTERCHWDFIKLTMKISEDLNRKLLLGVITLFVSVCFMHYFSPRGLWLDEGLTFNSIRDFSYARIFGELQTIQAFPRVYLCMVKALSQNFGYHVWSLRFFSLIFMLGAFVVWLKLYRENIENSWLILLALLAWASAYRVTYYAAELKPYSMDVFSVALIVWFLHYQAQAVGKSPTRNIYWLVILLPMLIFFSYAAVFVFWMVCWNFLIMSVKDKKFWPVFALSTFVSIACLATLYMIDLRYSANLKGMHSYWQSYFVCTDSWYCFLKSFTSGTKRLVTFWWGTEKIHTIGAIVFIPFAMLALFIYGFKAWKKEGYKILSIDSVGFALLMELFVLGILKKYPFTGERVTLFFAPIAFYMIIKGIDRFVRPKALKVAAWGYYVIFCLLCLANSLFVYLKEYQ